MVHEHEMSDTLCRLIEPPLWNTQRSAVLCEHIEIRCSPLSAMQGEHTEIRCSPLSAMQGEARRLRETLTPYILQLRTSAVVHQWTRRQNVVRASAMHAEQARVYNSYADAFAAQLAGESASSQRNGGEESAGDVSTMTAADGEDECALAILVRFGVRPVNGIFDNGFSGSLDPAGRQGRDLAAQR